MSWPVIVSRNRYSASDALKDAEVSRARTRAGKDNFDIIQYNEVLEGIKKASIEEGKNYLRFGNLSSKVVLWLQEEGYHLVTRSYGYKITWHSSPKSEQNL
jgi:hypothetical protein